MREKFGQHWSAFSGSARIVEANEKAAEVRGIEVLMLGARGLEPLTSTVSKSERSANASKQALLVSSDIK